MRYRREIDGLRAVAVLPVILFHAGVDAFGGGFVGVDVFFVISGYLITSILIEELGKGRVSLLRFYERRARRILPALFFVMLACLPFAYFWMPPVQLKDFAQSLIAVVFFASNVLFWLEVGYFAAAAELKPLLHTWSLAVEEQYYLLFPLVLFFLWRYGRKAAFLGVIALALLSFLLAEWAWRTMPNAGFYLSPTRAWELLAGSICAFLTVGKVARSNEILSGTGLALILFAVLAYDATIPSPSVYMLVPVIGTVLVILYASDGNLAGRLLSLPLLVGIGLISYSAYLWHQPLFAFARLYSVKEPDQGLMAFLVVATLLLAWATWAWVEQPFRRSSDPLIRTRAGVFLSSGLAGVAFLGLGLAGQLGQGFPSRYDDLQRKILAQSQPISFDCGARKDCLLGSATGEFSGTAFIGDSHMARYGYLLDEAMEERGLSAQLVVGAWCAPLLHWRSPVAERCGGANGQDFENAILRLLDDPSVHTVVLAAQWANYTTGYRHGSDAIPYDFALDGATNSKVDNNPEEFTNALTVTLNAIMAAGKRVVIVGPVPEYDFDVPQAALRLAASAPQALEDFSLARTSYEGRNIDVFRALDQAPDATTFIDPWAMLCDEASCNPFSNNGFPLYNDGNHLLLEGMVDIVAEILRNIAE